MPNINELDNTASDIKLFNRYQARDILVRQLNKNPELFLQRTTNLDKGVIYSIFLDESIKNNLNYEDQTINDTNIESPYIRVQYDLEIDIPYRIALIGWMLLDSFHNSILSRLFDYALNNPEKEKRKFFNTQVEYILKGFTTREAIEEIFQDPELNKFIDRKLRECVRGFNLDSQ